MVAITKPSRKMLTEDQIGQTIEISEGVRGIYSGIYQDYDVFFATQFLKNKSGGVFLGTPSEVRNAFSESAQFKTNDNVEMVDDFDDNQVGKWLIPSVEVVSGQAEYDGCKSFFNSLCENRARGEFANVIDNTMFLATSTPVNHGYYCVQPGETPSLYVQSKIHSSSALLPVRFEPRRG